MGICEPFLTLITETEVDGTDILMQFLEAGQ